MADANMKKAGTGKSALGLVLVAVGIIAIIAAVVWALMQPGVLEEVVNIAVIAILVLMHEITHSRALGLVAIFVYSASLVDKIIEGVVSLAGTKITWLADINIRKYLMMFNIEEGYLAEGYYPLTLLVVCLIYGTAATFLAIRSSVRRDVR